MPRKRERLQNPVNVNGFHVPLGAAIFPDCFPDFFYRTHICKRPFAWENYLALKVHNHHIYDCFIVRHGPDQHRHLSQSQYLTGRFASMAGNQFVTSLADLTRHRRMNYAMCFNALNKMPESLIIPYLKRMILKRLQLFQRDVLYRLFLISPSHNVLLFQENGGLLYPKIVGSAAVKIAAKAYKMYF